MGVTEAVRVRPLLLEPKVLFERVEYYDELVDDEADEADEADGSPDLRRLRLGSSGYTVMIGSAERYIYRAGHAWYVMA